MKHGGGRIQVWGCSTARSVGHIHHIKGILKQKVYKQILIHHMRASLLQFGGKDKIIFQNDNDSKHTAKSVENYIKRAKYQVLQNWPEQSDDINPIENLWQELKIRLAQTWLRPTNKGERFDVVKREWNALSEKLLLSLLSGYKGQRRTNKILVAYRLGRRTKVFQLIAICRCVISVRVNMYQ